jgi:hypothetical protein
MTPEGFKPAIPPSERLQTHNLDLAATGMSSIGDEAFLLAKRELSQVSRRSLQELPAMLLTTVYDLTCICLRNLLL